MSTITNNASGRAISDYSDLVYGTLEADWIDGKGGADLIYGKAGDDVIIGGRGNDILNGGWGNDRFYFGLQHDSDTIQDFGHTLGNHDLVVLDPAIDGYFAFSESAGIRLVTIDQGAKQGSVTLSGVAATQWADWGGHLGYQTDPVPGVVEFHDTAWLSTAWVIA